MQDSINRRSQVLASPAEQYYGGKETGGRNYSGAGKNIQSLRQS